MKKLIGFFTLLVCITLTLQAQKYQYETVKNDPYGTKIYTLKNGLKVYMSVYKDVPKIQTYIAVRVGSKNDPAETTGLAHYLEHLMFKGTPNVGTLNWSAEKPILDEIEALFEVYRQESDPDKRTMLYKSIDSLSYLASTYAIPNEYGKVMKFIGSTGTNAWTSKDQTVYTEQIPANQLENWAIVQADRFQQPVIRLFHTELETVYEEKNRSLANDSRRASDTMLLALFPNHPYGTQTTLGESEHLKNPSIKNIRQFIETYYVPNNIAICLAGDFNPDEAVAIIEKYFGNWQPKSLPESKLSTTKPARTHSIEKHVVGIEPAFVNVAFTLGIPANHKDIYCLRMLNAMLSNGKTGLIDVNINQRHLASSAASYPYIMTDNSAFVLYAKPKQDQSLEELRDMLLAQLTLIKKGEFDEALLQAAVNNMRLSEMRQLESIEQRGQSMLNAFTNDIPWSEASQSIHHYAQITKADIIQFANKYFNDNQAVIVYKEQGDPTPTDRVVKPAITPIQINRDAESTFFTQLKQRAVPMLEPQFVDLQKDITHSQAGNHPFHYVKNVENKTFSLTLRFNSVGELFDKRWVVVDAISSYLGTTSKSMEEVKQAFYKLACSFYITAADDYVEVRLLGLSENFDQAYALMMEILTQPELQEDTYTGVIEKMVKSMRDAKTNQSAILNALRSYGEYGEALVNYSLKPEAIEKLTPTEVLDLYKTLIHTPVELFYYGPLSSKQFANTIKKSWKNITSDEKIALATEQTFKNQEVKEDYVLFVPFAAKQSRLVTYSRGPIFDPQLLPIITMYNTYFGGGMNAIVFQEMREKRSLAYTAQSSYVMPSEAGDYMYNYSFIGTQNDKIEDALTAFNELFNEMPTSPIAFDLAQKSVKNSIANVRYTKSRLLSFYTYCHEKGYNYDYRRDIWQAVEGFTLNDVVRFNEQYIKNQPKLYMIMAQESDVNFSNIESKFGKVRKLSLEEIFGF